MVGEGEPQAVGSTAGLRIQLVEEGRPGKEAEGQPGKRAEGLRTALRSLAQAVVAAVEVEAARAAVAAPLMPVAA